MSIAPETGLQGATTRAPASFSPIAPLSPQWASQRPAIRRVDSSDSDDLAAPLLAGSHKRNQNAQAQQHPSPPPPAIVTSPTTAKTVGPDTSTTSPQNFSRPTTTHSRGGGDYPAPSGSPLVLGSNGFNGSNGSSGSNNDSRRTHARKHPHSQGFFEPSLPASSFLSAESVGFTSGMAPNPNLTASQIAAQAAMQHQQHSRQRSQTLPLDTNNTNGPRRPQRGPASPPVLSLTEASGERQSGFGNTGGQIYRHGLLGGSQNAAATAASLVFPRSSQSSPGLPPTEFTSLHQEPERPAKAEKVSKVKLFSRPGKIGTKDTKDKPIPSPNKMTNYAMSALQRSNMSTTSLADTTMSSASSMYSMANSSTATIRAIETPVERGGEKEKEKKHNFLSRQKHKMSSKDDHHLPLSSAASNSRPVDPHAPSSLYNFLPASPGPTSTSFAKSMSGLDLRHGGRALREKKKEEKAAAGSESALRESEMTYPGGSEWPGPSSLGSVGGQSMLGPNSRSYTSASSAFVPDAQDLTKYGLHNMTPDDAWPFLKAKLLIIFEGEDLRLPVEDFNRLVTTHLQRCIQKRLPPNTIVDDLRDLLATGFSSLDQTLRRTPDERLIPRLVEMWLFTFTSILPYMQAVFLPLDLEFSGHGPLMSPEASRDFWGALHINHSSSPQKSSTSTVPASQMLEVRRIVLTAYRDKVILPRFDTLKTIFSRLSLESINSNLNSLENLSSSPDSFGGRPGTAMSLDPAHASYNSQTTTLLGGAESVGARSRAISNVSYGSDQASSFPRDNSAMPPPLRPFTPSSTHPSLMGSSRGEVAAAISMQREVNAEESKNVTEIVGRMLQCMSVLASVGVVAGAGSAGDEEAQERMEVLCRALKLNWLGRGRTGRNRRGFVGARVRPGNGIGNASRTVEGGILGGGGGIGMGMGSLL